MFESTEARLTLEQTLIIFQEGDFQTRWHIAKTFSQFGEQAIPPLIAILEDKRAELEQRWFAARILAEFSHPQVLSALVNCLKTTEEEELSEVVAEALAKLGKSSLHILSNLLSQPESKLLATSCLAHIRSSQVITPLLTVVEDENAEVRAIAIEALSSFHDSRVPPVLIAALEDYTAGVRKEAVIGLGMRADLAEELDLFSHLQPLLWDLNLEVCQQTAIALSKLGTEAAATALFTVLQSKTTPVPLQITIIQALGWMETPTSLAYLQKNLSGVTEKSALEIIRVLGRVESRELKEIAGEILLNFFNSHPAISSKTLIKQALAHAWGQLVPINTREALMKLKQDPEASVRLQAIAALKHF